MWEDGLCLPLRFSPIGSHLSLPLPTGTAVNLSSRQINLKWAIRLVTRCLCSPRAFLQISRLTRAASL